MKKWDMTVATHKSAVAKDAESKNPVLLIQARFKGEASLWYHSRLNYAHWCI